MPVPTFCRAPLHMRYNRESYFEPRFVSIGPLYSEKLMEQSVVEKAKDKCISYFTRGSQASPSNLLGSLVRQIINVDDKEMLLDQILRWYGKNFGLQEDDLFWMLVRDSCFIIRIILAFSREGEESMFYPGVDIKTVRFDLLLLENQIPFFFLGKVYNFFRDNNMLPSVTSENYPNSHENGMTQSPKGNTYMCCLPIRKQSNISESTTGQTHSHGPQPTPYPEQSQNNESQYPLSPEQNKSHEPQPILSQEKSQNNRSQYNLSPGHSRSNGPQPTLSPEQSQNNGSLYTLSPEQSHNNGSQNTLSPDHSQSHGPQPTLYPEQSQNNGSQNTLSPCHSQSHGPQPTLYLEQRENNGPQLTHSPEPNQNHRQQPSLSLEQNQSHGPQLTLSQEQSQNNRLHFTLSPEQSQSHGHQPIFPSEQSPNHQSQLSVGSLLPSRSSPVQTTTLSDDEFLKELKPFIWLDMPWQFYEYAEFTEPKHLLDLYWKWCIPPLKNGPASNPLQDDGVHASWVKMHLRSNAPKKIKSAYELYRKAGVTFKKREHKYGFDVKFRKGILQIPHLQLDPNQTTLLANLVAFEEFKPSNERLLTSYVLLLDGLINTEKDVEVLQRYGVITNKLYSSQLTASTYFNDIGNVCLVDYNDHYCRKQFADLNSYYDSKWNNRFAKLRLKYLNSPWAVISFSAGATLLIFAGLQTVYNLLRYYQHR